MNNKLLLIKVALVLLAISGCTTTPVAVLPPTPSPEVEVGKSPASDKPVEKAKTKVDIPEDLLKECPVLLDLPNNNPNGKDVLKQKSVDTGMYTECRRKNLLLVKILRAAFNLK